jgi:hypothetical protein
MYRNINKKIFHVVSIIIIVFFIVFVAGMLVLRYQVEGESNMPFNIAKISIIESVEGIENKDTTETWNFNVNENNDIYIYIEKNSEYGKTELIESVKISNIIINKKSKLGEVRFYKPTADEKRMFNSTKENEVNEIIYNGELSSNIKELKISNQGGIVAFRYAINNLAKYTSQDNEEIDHSKLLKLTNVKNEDIETKISFNIEIYLKSGKKYQATIEQEILPNDIIEKGTTWTEKTDLDNIVFKRVEN